MFAYLYHIAFDATAVPGLVLFDENHMPYLRLYLQVSISVISMVFLQPAKLCAFLCAWCTTSLAD